MNTNMNIAIFDVETDRLLEKKPGSSGHEDLRITVACGAVITSISESPTVRTFYGTAKDALELSGETLDDLGKMLDDADAIVAYNGRWFDLRVLRNHLPKEAVDRWEAKLVDPFEAIKDHTGSWVKLDELLEANDLPRKSANGVSAVEWWAEGRKREVADYCNDDVSGLVALLALGQFAFPVKKWRAGPNGNTVKMKQEIVGWSELNWSAYLAKKTQARRIAETRDPDISDISDIQGGR